MVKSQSGHAGEMLQPRTREPVVVLHRALMVQAHPAGQGDISPVALSLSLCCVFNPSFLSLFLVSRAAAKGTNLETLSWAGLCTLNTSFDGAGSSSSALK